jgi:hypothetical protein
MQVTFADFVVAPHQVSSMLGPLWGNGAFGFRPSAFGFMPSAGCIADGMWPWSPHGSGLKPSSNARLSSLNGMKTTRHFHGNFLRDFAQWGPNESLQEDLLS